MKIRFYFVSILAGLLLLAALSVARAGYSEGRDAYDNRDYATALKELVPAAASGDARAQRLLGHMYRLGRGVRADMVRGTTLIHKAAKKGFAPAQYDLGVIFYNIAVTEQMYARAVKWLTAASLQGHVEAQFHLAKMYRDGDGVEPDDVRALVLLNAAGKKIRNARGARTQLRKRMSKDDVSRAINMKMAVFKKPAKIRGFAESKELQKDVKGECGVAGKGLYLSSVKLEELSGQLKDCLGEEWSGDLCTAQVDRLKKAAGQINVSAKAMIDNC